MTSRHCLPYRLCQSGYGYTKGDFPGVIGNGVSAFLIGNSGFKLNFSRIKNSWNKINRSGSSF